MNAVSAGPLVDVDAFRVYYYEVDGIIETLNFIAIKMGSVDDVRIRIRLLMGDLQELRREIGAVIATE